MFELQLDQVHLASWTQDGIGLIKKSREKLRKVDEKLTKNRLNVINSRFTRLKFRTPLNSTKLLTNFKKAFKLPLQ